MTVYLQLVVRVTKKQGYLSYPYFVFTVFQLQLLREKKCFPCSLEAKFNEFIKHNLIFFSEEEIIVT